MPAGQGPGPGLLVYVQSCMWLALSLTCWQLTSHDLCQSSLGGGLNVTFPPWLCLTKLRLGACRILVFGDPAAAAAALTALAVAYMHLRGRGSFVLLKYLVCRGSRFSASCARIIGQSSLTPGTKCSLGLQDTLGLAGGSQAGSSGKGPGHSGPSFWCRAMHAVVLVWRVLDLLEECWEPG